MKKRYEQPSFEMTWFQVEDELTSNGTEENGGLLDDFESTVGQQFLDNASGGGSGDWKSTWGN